MNNVYLPNIGAHAKKVSIAFRRAQSRWVLDVHFPLKPTLSGSSCPSPSHYLQGYDFMNLLIWMTDQLLSMLAYICVAYVPLTIVLLTLGLKISRSFSNGRYCIENKGTKRLHWKEKPLPKRCVKTCNPNGKTEKLGYLFLPNSHFKYMPSYFNQLEATLFGIFSKIFPPISIQGSA